MPAILVVCTANQCRSPVAAALLRRRLTDSPHPGPWQVASAGTWARPNAPAAALMVQVAEEWGIDLRDHRAQEVNAQLLAEQDLVLVMERGQKEALALEFPWVTPRLHLLSELAGPAYDVADPIDQALDDYQATAQELDELIERGLARMIALGSGVIRADAEDAELN